MLPNTRPFNLGVAVLELGKKDEAVAEFKAVQRISPLYPEIDEVLNKIVPR